MRDRINGLAVQALAASAAIVHGVSAGLEVELDDMGPEEQGAWCAVAREMDVIADEDHPDGMKASELAARLYETYFRKLTGMHAEGAFPHLEPLVRLRWEAVGRHLAGVIDQDEAPDLETEQQTWRGWATERASRILQGAS